MSKLRDAFLNEAPASEIVEINFKSGPMKVEVREKTVKQQFDLIDKCRYKSGPKAGEINNELLQYETILTTVYDPETGEPVFEDADRDHLKRMAAGPFNQLLAAANKAAGLDDDIEVVSGLDETPTAESSSG